MKYNYNWLFYYLELKFFILYLILFFIFAIISKLKFNKFKMTKILNISLEFLIQL